jgi:ubiquinone/menaquinone biosynthesis C-methylase UbiE
MFADPNSILSGFDLKSGMHVADLGTGSGFYALAAARLIGSKGRVYAVEVQKDLLDRVKNNASREGLHNIEVVWGDIETSGGTHLRDSSMDRVIVSNTLFQIEEKERFIREVFRILRPSGKVLVIDWDDASDLSGPDRNHLIGKETAKDVFLSGGFNFEKEIPAGSHHYGIIMVRK